MHQALLLQIFSVGEQSPTVVAATAKEFVATRAASLPPGINLAVNRDMSEIFDQRMVLLFRNASFGLVLVLVILGLFI